MRLGSVLLVLLPPLLMSGCGPEAPVVAGAVVAVSGASLPVFHRTPVDMVASAMSGRDCSAVYLEKGQFWCRPKERPPEPPEFCTRSLGVPDCWRNPAKLPNHPLEIADGPRTLTPEQEADRTRRWFGLW